jgi:hypothetical protein
MNSLSGSEIGVVMVDGGFQSRRLRGFQQGRTGDAQFAAEVEQVVLDAGEQFANIGGQVFAEDDAEQRVEFIDVAHGGDAGGILGGARTVAEAGGAGIAGAGVDFREAVSHGVSCGRVCPDYDSDRAFASLRGWLPRYAMAMEAIQECR